jgi:hypothetical protein
MVAIILSPEGTIVGQPGVATPGAEDAMRPVFSQPATPNPLSTDPPYGIGEMVVPAGLTPSEMGDNLFLMEGVETLTLRDVLTTSSGATAVYLDDTYPEAPRFGMAVAARVEPATDAAATVAALERDRWGDPAQHDLTAAGDGANGEPAFREFSRTFEQGQFLLPFRRVFFLIWYRAGDEYAFTVIGDSPAVRAGIAAQLASVFPDEESG